MLMLLLVNSVKEIKVLHHINVQIHTAVLRNIGNNSILNIKEMDTSGYISQFVIFPSHYPESSFFHSYCWLLKLHFVSNEDT